MKRNQVIAAMQALPEDCDAEFNVLPLDKSVEIMSMLSIFLALAEERFDTEYEVEDWPLAIVDVFSRLDLGVEALALYVQSKTVQEQRVSEANDQAMRRLAKLAMR